MLKRKIIEKIESWKQTKTGQGLLITGARQVGKTSAVEQFARDNYRSFLKIDFVERPDAVELIGEARSLDDLIVRITALASSPIASDTKTLLFFDEVQRSNMSKACGSMEEALSTQEMYLREKSTESSIVLKGDKYLVYRKEDGKVLKSVAYSPAQIKA